MKIGRLELFITKNGDGSICWSFFGYNCGSCECHIFTLGPVGFTWLSEECMISSKKDEFTNGE